ncbi:zinc finger protein 512B-like [Varroa jacobsoni]|uniref:zinc finger protein 512B-like n=1 Tax=Varroa jacobsoni TaxID=62625 RepID=UPI000BF3B41B|nr:zinc finger protein 512B-like [Varroa jacobsoni]
MFPSFTLPSSLKIVVVAVLGFVEAHQSVHSQNTIQAFEGPKAIWSGGSAYFRWVPHHIALPKPIFSVRRVPLPFPYPVFRYHQVPMYTAKDLPPNLPGQATIQVPVEVPKYVPVSVHKVIEVPQYIEVPVEVPVYQEVVVRKPIEVPIPVYITRKAIATTQSGPLVAGDIRAFDAVDTGLTPAKVTQIPTFSESASVPISKIW